MPQFIVRALFFVIASLSLAPQRSAAQYTGERLFYYVDREDSYKSLVKHVDQITVLGPQVYVVDSLGIMWGSLDKRVDDLARKHGVKIMPLFTNEGFQQPGLRKLLADTVARNRAIASMVALCKAHDYWGIQFDVENINIADRDRFTQWYSDAAKALHKAGYKISIAVVHKTEESAGPTAYGRFMEDSWRGGYDIPALARAGDFISLMTYSEHTRRTTPGPVAGLPWTREALEYFLKFVPPEKLSLGIPTYGGRWYTRYDGTGPDRASSTSESVSWSWGSGFAERHGSPIIWDPVQQVPYASYTVGGINEWLFLEDARAFKAKLDLAKEKKVRGFSVWVLGPEDERIWDVLRNDKPGR
ncbi:MAG TPA: glycosyl hydrolase family 18 protein [Gemmatimonadaceae bacterium]|nr:glycosyl hydrolase family 18 protein [Gemmatimonadaceae bacterium]